MSDRRRNEDGTVLLSTLLVLSLISAVALALLATLRQSVDRTRTLEASAQADLYLAGARDFARAQMDALIRIDGPALNRQLLQSDPIVLPFDNGAIALTVSDGTHCLRLSALADSAGQASDMERQRLEGLMTGLGVDGSMARQIAAAAVDWVDADSQAVPGGAEDGTYLSRQVGPGGVGGPHRTANTAMASVTELRALDGMSEPIFQRLLPHVCIGQVGAPSTFNIDSAEARHLPVLAALLGGDAAAERLASDLLQARPTGGYGSIEALPETAVQQAAENSAVDLSSTLVFRPQRLAVEVTVRYADVQRQQLLAFEGVDSPRPVLSYRAPGAAEFPSLAWASLDVRSDEERADP